MIEFHYTDVGGEHWLSIIKDKINLGIIIFKDNHCVLSDAQVKSFENLFNIESYMKSDI